MHSYVIKYKDPDLGCPVFRMTIKAYGREDALERFYALPGDNDWDIVSVERGA